MAESRVDGAVRGRDCRHDEYEPSPLAAQHASQASECIQIVFHMLEYIDAHNRVDAAAADELEITIFDTPGPALETGHV